MNLTSLTLRNNRIALIAFLFVAVSGWQSYQSMARNDMPPFTIRVASVVTQFPGAGPERVESLVTSKLEEAIQEIPELDYVASESRTGLSIISVALKEDVPARQLRAVWDSLRRKMDAKKKELPQGIKGPDVKDEDIGVVYGILIGLTGDGFTYAEIEAYADAIRDQLIRLPGASRVEIRGTQEERVYVDFDPARLAQLGISSGQLSNTIASRNIIVPGGDIEIAGERIILEPTGNFDTLDQLRETIVQTGRQGEFVYLGDITTIYKGYVSPTESLVRVEGERGLSIGISLKPGANLLRLGEAVDRRLAELLQDLPIGIELRRLASQDVEVSKSVSDFISNLMQSIMVVLAVMLIFLGMRTGIVVATLIPAAIIACFFTMGIFGIGLNKVSLAALIMALGMLVDNAIVMVESMMVKIEAGSSRADAAIESSKELAAPLLISSLTTSAAFLSFFLAESTMGEIVGPLFSVITITLLCSWLMALTIVPVIAVSMLDKNSGAGVLGPVFERISPDYKRLIEWALHNRGRVIGGMVVAFLISLQGFGLLPFIFFPESERPLVTVDINLPLGTTIERTATVVEELEGFIRESLLVNEEREAGIVDWSAFVGEGPTSYDLGYQPGEADSGYAHLLINTTHGDDNEAVIDALDRTIFTRFPDAKYKVKRLSGGGGSGIPVAVRVSGDDPDVLFEIVEKIKDQLRATEGARNIDDNWGLKSKKLVVNIDAQRANDAGITHQEIATSLQSILTGSEVGQFRQGEDAFPIYMRRKGDQDLSVAELETSQIVSQNTGRSAPLVQMAAIDTSWQFSKILRRNLYRTVTVEAYVKSGYTAADVSTAFAPWLAAYAATWPNGYDYELGGEAEESADGMGAVSEKLPVSGFIILLLLVIQFNSLRKTAIVLSTIPLGIIGVVAGLLLVRSFFGFFAFLGIISLAGIVINNAIVLIDRIGIELDSDKTPYEAIVQAALHRFRPILLTAATTVLGLLPLWFGGGLMWEPMAIGIIFGLLFATIITLVFVPVVYAVLFQIPNPPDTSIKTGGS